MQALLNKNEKCHVSYQKPLFKYKCKPCSKVMCKTEKMSFKMSGYCHLSTFQPNYKSVLPTYYLLASYVIKLS